MPDIGELVARMEENPRNVSFSTALKVGTAYFGSPRVHGSHFVFSTPWPGDPRVNIQNCRGTVAPYQVKQLLAAVRKMEEMQDASR